MMPRVKLKVYLRYEDRNDGLVHKIPLEPRANEKYSYSFDDLSPKTMKPLGMTRVMPMER